MTTPRVSVILPAFNAERTLSASIESVLKQSYEDFELFVIDDGSSDGTRDVARSFSDQRIRLIEHEHNKGIVATLNEGLAMARGEFVARQDADDVALPNRFAAQVDRLVSDPAVGAVGSALQTRYDDGRLGDIWRYPATSWLSRWASLFTTPVAHCAVVYRKALVVAVGGYSEGFPWAEDFHLWSRLQRQADIVSLQICLQIYSHGSASVSRQNAERQQKTHVSICAANMELLLGTPVPARLAKILSLGPDRVGSRLEDKDIVEALALLRALLNAFCQNAGFAVDRMEGLADDFILRSMRVFRCLPPSRRAVAIWRYRHLLLSGFWTSPHLPGLLLPDEVKYLARRLAPSRVVPGGSSGKVALLPSTGRPSIRKSRVCHTQSAARMPSVSVVLPAYNCASIVGRAIRSVLAQTYPVSEIVVVDDGSTDDICAALAPFGSSVRCLTQRNSGPGAARNHGLRSVSGEFLAFIDADDEWLSGKLESQVALLRQFPDAVLCYGPMRNVSPDGTLEQVWPTLVADAPSTNSTLIERWASLRDLPPTSTVLIRKALLAEHHIFPSAMCIAEDLDLWVRLLAKGAFVGTGTVLALRHLRAQSLTATAPAIQQYLSYLRVAQTRRRDIELWAGPHAARGAAVIRTYAALSYLRARRRLPAAAHALLALRDNPERRLAGTVLAEALLGQAPYGWLSSRIKRSVAS